MAHALRLGARGLGLCWPNPSVGCLIVREGRIVGRGWTAPGGRPHAETQALARAGTAARGATAYVTLEPCAHHGLTPPCSGALAEAGVARVVVPFADPDPRVDGAGIARLRAAGIAVDLGVGAAAAAEAHGGFLQRLAVGRPRVTLKIAASLDGRIATATGESRWITGSSARREVHAMRARHDAVLVGGGTVRADDPSLTARDLGVAHQPVRVVASRHLDLPLAGALAETARAVPVWLLHGDDAPQDRIAAWSDRGARCIAVPTGKGRDLPPAAALSALGAAGLTRVLCEGGGTYAAALLAADLVDDLVWFSAGLALGAEARPALGALGVDHLAQAPRFVLAESRALGGDVLHRWTWAG